jgi:hypothetical protein
VVAEQHRWMDDAACKGATALMYDAVWPGDLDGGPADPDALEHARSMCNVCPVRRRCIELVMEHERGIAAANRYGVAAGMTPEQRWTLEKRRAMRCELCNEVLDPMKVRHGVYDCECGHRRSVAPIPDKGDAWSRRHTTLARRVIAFMIDGTAEGMPCPAPTPLADSWGVHKNDMVRVYKELHNDGLLARNAGDDGWVRTGAGVRRAEWRPLHLR